MAHALVRRYCYLLSLCLTVEFLRGGAGLPGCVRVPRGCVHVCVQCTCAYVCAETRDGGDVGSPRVDGFPSPSTSLPPSPLPGEPLRPAGTSRGRPLSCPAAQAHWRGYRQRKTYVQRLQYLKANSDAVIKVAVTVWVGSCPRGPSENTCFVLSPRGLGTAGLARAWGRPLSLGL